MNTYFDALKHRLERDFGFVVEREKGLDKEVLELVARGLMPHVASRMRTGNEDLARRLTFGVLKKPVINGYAWPTADNWRTFQIYVSWGFMVFLHKIIKLFLSGIRVVNDNGVVERTHISDEDTILVAERFMQAFWDNALWETPTFALTSLSKSQVQLGAYLLQYAESFVIAHEFGHVIMESCPEEARREIYIASSATEERIETLLRSLNVSEQQRRVALEKWPKEFAADLLGLELSLGQRDDSVGKMVVRSSAELVFISMLMLEGFREKSTGRNFWLHMYECEGQMGHPPSGLRLELLHSYVDPSDPSSTAQLGAAFKQWSDYILSRV